MSITWQIALTALVMAGAMVVFAYESVANPHDVPEWYQALLGGVLVVAGVASLAGLSGL